MCFNHSKGEFLMRKFLLAFMMTASAFAQTEFSEKGSWGLVGALTNDAFKVGIQRLEQNWEAGFLAHSEYTSKTENQVHSIFRAGLRRYLGSHNYFSYGLEYAPEVHGKGTYSDTGKVYSRSFKNYHAGGYIGLQRYFSGTNLMLNFWVLPVAYERQVDGQHSIVENRSYFVKGGVGVTYVLP